MVRRPCKESGVGSCSSSLGSWMGLSSWAQSWKPKPVPGESKKGWDGGEWWRRVMLMALSRGSSLGTQKAAKFNAFSWPISFYIPWSVSMHAHPSSIHPKCELFISLLHILLQGTGHLQAPLQHWPLWRGWGCLTGIPWIQTLGDKEETVSRSFHVSPSCLPIRVKI